MSRTKIVKKHGHLVRKRVRRCIPWKDEMLTLAGVSGGDLRSAHEDMRTHLSDADFLFWLFFLLSVRALRTGYTYSKVTPVFEGRGVSYLIFGNATSVKDIFRRVTTIFTHTWDKWLGWTFSVEALSTQSVGTYLRTPEERRSKGDITIELRIYPPLDTLAYDTCKLLWHECTGEGQCTSSLVLDQMYAALARNLAKKRKEKEGKVDANNQIPPQCK